MCLHLTASSSRPVSDPVGLPGHLSAESAGLRSASPLGSSRSVLEGVLPVTVRDGVSNDVSHRAPPPRRSPCPLLSLIPPREPFSSPGVAYLG